MPPNDKPRPTKDRDISWMVSLVDGAQAIMAVAMGGSAAVVAALGQFALALVLLVVALGIVLRLWRTRRRRRAADR